MIILIFSSVLFMVVAKRLFYGRFMNFIILPFNNKYVFMYNKKDKLMNWFHIFFTFFMVINFALFIYMVRNVLLDIQQGSHPLAYLVILGGLLLFLIAKVGLQMVNGFIFGSSNVIADLIFKKTSYLNYSSIIMFFANLVLLFIIRDSSMVIYVAIFLILLVNSIGWATTLKNHQKFLANNFFYFILYLCALEITPLVVIASYLNRG